MQCSNCGAELEDGVLFCRDCGTKVEKEIKFCRECGTRLNSGVKFCSSCGASVEPPIFVANPDGAVEDDDSPETVHTQYPQPESPDELNTDQDCAEEIDSQIPVDHVDNVLAPHHKLSGTDIQNRIRSTIANLWSSFDLFTKASAVIGIIAVLFFLFALIGHNSTAKVLAVFQLLLVIIAFLIHKQKITTDKLWLKFVALGLSAILMIPSLTSYKQKSNDAISRDISTAKDTITETAVAPDPVIPFDYDACLDRPYEDVWSEFEAAGFTAIEADTVEDLFAYEQDRIGTVESVTIDGNDRFSKGDTCANDVQVMIRYHVFKKCAVTVHVDFIPNLIFSKYNVSLTMNGSPVGKLEHGKDQDFSFVIDPGSYEFKFTEDGSSSVKGVTTLNVTGDTNAEYKIYCHSDKIDVDVVYVENLGDIKDGEIMIPASASTYKYKNYLEVQNAFEDMGFTNISTKILYDIVWGWTSEGEIANVAIDGNTEFIRGDIFSSDAQIVITYHMKEDDNPEKQTIATEETGTTEPITEPVTEATVPTEAKIYDLDKDLVVTKCQRDADKTTMYYIRFSEKDSSGNYIRDYEFDNCINPRTMGKNFNAIGDLPSWFYVGATVHVQANFGYNGLKDCNVTEVSTATSTPNDTNGSDNPAMAMPIMHGLTVDTIMNAAKQYGISVQPFSDEDFGGGTKHRELTNSSNGLNLEFTYDSNTKEVLCASIVTFTKLSSAQEQKNVVIGMSKILCPSEDSTAVSNWVSSNIGKKAETTINNFVYELWLGPSGNICYNAGVQNWEQWELNRE